MKLKINRNWILNQFLYDKNDPITRKIVKDQISRSFVSPSAVIICNATNNPPNVINRGELCVDIKFKNETVNLRIG